MHGAGHKVPAPALWKGLRAAAGIIEQTPSRRRCCSLAYSACVPMLSICGMLQPTNPQWRYLRSGPEGQLPCRADCTIPFRSRQGHVNRASVFCLWALDSVQGGHKVYILISKEMGTNNRPIECRTAYQTALLNREYYLLISLIHVGNKNRKYSCK